MYTTASSNVIEQRLTNLLPSKALEDHAEAVGVIEREGKLQIPPLVWSFAFGFARRKPNAGSLPAELQFECRRNTLSGRVLSAADT